MSIIEKAVDKLDREPKSTGTDSDAASLPGKRSTLEAGQDFLADEVVVDSNAIVIDEANHVVAPPDAVGELSIPPNVKRSEVESAAPTLSIDFPSLQKRGFIAPTSPRSRIADEFRGIKRPLLRNISRRKRGGEGFLNLIMVTSALQGDGKTFSSINLALSIAMERDNTVLFVDADVVRATAGRALGVEPGTPGLIDLLDEGNDIDPSDIIMRTNIENLRVLPAGNASDKSTELLASQTMHDFMIELSGRYQDRVIIFDSPPLLLTTEASVLASFMGQIVFVASADITPQHAVQEALEQIGEDKMAGVILNRASRRRSKMLGIGSYGYGYGYGYGDDRDAGGDDSRSPALDAEQT